MASLSEIHSSISSLSTRTRIREGRYEVPYGVRATNVINNVAYLLRKSKQSRGGYGNYTELAVAVCNDLIERRLIVVLIPSGTRYVWTRHSSLTREHYLTSISVTCRTVLILGCKSIVPLTPRLIPEVVPQVCPGEPRE